jgi:hypothetical protein
VALNRQFDLDPATYRPHALHGGERAWVESNCYVDLWIEVLATLGLDPHAALGFCAAVDFEGDQWTFFKPPLADLLSLHGLDVQELCVWDALGGHVDEQLARGRLVIVEADAFWLRDTAGTTYRAEHGKTAIAVERLDLAAGTMGYFHNGGYFHLDGEDVQHVLAPPGLPPYVELVRLDRLRTPTTVDAWRALTAHFARRPSTSPAAAFAARFTARDRAWLEAGSLPAFHRWAFATLRQCGAAHELLASHLRWLDAARFAEPAARFDELAQSAKAVQFRVARAVNRKKPIAIEDGLAAIVLAYDAGMRALGAELG